MHITLGKTLDGGSYPTDLAGSTASVGRANLGPDGFLRKLEQALGVPPHSVREPVRVAQYARRLARHDDEKQFYSGSRQVDSWRVARKLLSLRDELFLAGWRGEHVEHASPRLRVFAELEGLGSDYPLANGLADRLRTIIERLEFVPAHIDGLDLVDPTGGFEKLWRDVFAALGRKGTRVQQREDLTPTGTGDLGLAQQGLLGEKQERVTGDGSLVRLECKGLMEAAEMTAAALAAMLETEEPETIVLIRDGEQREGMVLEKALHRFGIPTTGLSVASSHRPATQILPLFLGLAWEPVDPDLLVAFLTLPSSPIPRSARERLRRALNESPGYNSQAWLRARREAIEGITDSGDKERATYVDQQLGLWLDDVPRTHVRSEMSVSEAMRLTAQVVDWANGRAHADQDEPFYFQATGQAQMMRQLLELHPRESINRAELGRLLFDVSRTGISHELEANERGSVHRVGSPASIFGPVPIVIWWHCVGGAAPVPPPAFWTEDEGQALRQAGCELLSPEEILLENARAARRPILCATRRVILVQPEQAFGEPQESHSIWNEIAMKIAPTDSEQLEVTATPHSILDGTAMAVGTKETHRRRLPGPKPTWKLPPEHLAPSETESPTSLERLLGCQLRWVLYTRARLREPLIQVVEQRQLLYGNLAHRIVGEYLESFINKPLPQMEDARAAIAERFDQCVAAEAATLIKPGMDRERTYVRATLRHSSGVLVDLLRRGGWRVHSVEEKHTDSFSFGKMEGRTDLVVRRNKDGMKAIVDLKWSGDRGKTQALENGTALQLAAYAYFHRNGNRWPTAAYFVFPSAQLFATNDSDFPGCTLIPGPDEKTVWDSALLAIQRVRSEMDEGNVTVTGFEDPDAEPIADGAMQLQPPCRYCDFQMFCRYS